MIDAIRVETEWQQLIAVAVIRPKYFATTEPVNRTQRKFYGRTDRPVMSKMMSQHDHVLRTLSAEGIRVVEIPASVDLPLQFNVRDAAAVVGSCFVVGRMAHSIRRRETDALVTALEIRTPLSVEAGTLEGGDLMVTPDEVFVGLGERTDRGGCTGLAGVLTGDRTVTPICLAGGVLHLDIAMNLLGPTLGVLHRPSISGPLPRSLDAVTWIEVTDEEFGQQAVNVLAVGPRTVVADTRHVRLHKLLAEHGMRCIQVDLDEITKVGGGVRCMTLPLLREHEV